jgi:hypothetical protein
VVPWILGLLATGSLYMFMESIEDLFFLTRRRRSGILFPCFPLKYRRIPDYSVNFVIHPRTEFIVSRSRLPCVCPNGPCSLTDSFFRQGIIFSQTQHPDMLLNHFIIVSFGAQFLDFIFPPSQNISHFFSVIFPDEL